MPINCSIPACPNFAFARGWCKTHYSRWRSGRSLDTPIRLRVNGSIEEQFWARVEKTDTCWLWRGSIKPNGYGRLDGEYAHRLSYKLAFGTITEGLQLDHLCRVRHCVRPDHLEPVTLQVNLERGEGNGSKTHCPAGHEYNQANTYVDPAGGRHCRICRKTKARTRYHLNHR